MVPIVMALGSCDFAYIRIHRRTGKHRLLSEGEIKRCGLYYAGNELEYSRRHFLSRICCKNSSDND